MIRLLEELKVQLESNRMNKIKKKCILCLSDHLGSIHTNCCKLNVLLVHMTQFQIEDGDVVQGVTK